MRPASPPGRRKPADTKEQDTFWITDPEQIAALVSPRRQEIADHLASLGPMSIREHAVQIGARPSALYHHIEQLEKVGLVVASGSRIVNRRREMLYTTPAPRMRLIRALADPANREIFKEIVGALTRQMDRDFERGLSSDRRQVLGAGRNLGFFRLVAAPSPETLEKINALLGEIAELLWLSDAKADGAGDHLAFAWTISPIGPARDDQGDALTPTS